MTLLHQAAQKAVEALKRARQFIHNGVEYGYIRMPDDDCPDSAHETPHVIFAALKALESALQHQEVPREPEPVGTFACSVCGVAEPHHHDIAHINKRRVEEAVLRPRFEQLLHNLMQGGEPFSELRVSGWGNPIFWNKRWPTPSIEMPAAYRDMKAEALWQLFLRAHYAASPSTTQQQEVGSDAEPDGEGPIRDGWQVSIGPGHAGFGVYAHMTDYPEEGAVCICTIDPSEYPAAAPSTPENAEKDTSNGAGDMQ